MQLPIHVFLSVHQARLTSDELSQLLGLRPHSVRAQGGIGAVGKEEPSLPSEGVGYWAHMFSSHDGVDASGLALQVLEQLKPRRAQLAHIKACGGQTVLAVPVGTQEEIPGVRETLRSHAGHLPIVVRVEVWGHPHRILG